MQSIFDRLKARSGWQVTPAVITWGAGGGGADHLQKFWAKWDTKIYKKVTSKKAFRGRQTDRALEQRSAVQKGGSHSFFLCSLSTHFENPTVKHKSIQKCIVKEAHSKLNTGLWLCNEGDREKKSDYNYKIIFNFATILIIGLRLV